MTTIHEFIAAQGITATCSSVDANPNMDSDTPMDHWRVVLKRPGAKMSVYFSMGKGHHGKEPTAAEVLDCLALDADAFQADAFEEWAESLGYDTDSRKAHRIYMACRRTGERLLKFLGGDAYDELVAFGLVERL